VHNLISYLKTGLMLFQDQHDVQVGAAAVDEEALEHSVTAARHHTGESQTQQESSSGCGYACPTPFVAH
jgi:hypothetical protein